jgi:hypothetical protein
VLLLLLAVWIVLHRQTGADRGSVDGSDSIVVATSDGNNATFTYEDIGHLKEAAHATTSSADTVKNPIYLVPDRRQTAVYDKANADGANANGNEDVRTCYSDKLASTGVYISGADLKSVYEVPFSPENNEDDFPFVLEPTVSVGGDNQASAANMGYLGFGEDDTSNV